MEKTVEKHIHVHYIPCVLNEINVIITYYKDISNTFFVLLIL